MPNRERGEKIFGRKREKLSGGGKALGGKGEKDLRERGGGGGKILGRKGRRSGDKGFRGERGEMISTGKGWKRS